MGETILWGFIFAAPHHLRHLSRAAWRALGGSGVAALDHAMCGYAATRIADAWGVVDEAAA